MKEINVDDFVNECGQVVRIECLPQSTHLVQATPEGPHVRTLIVGTAFALTMSGSSGAGDANKNKPFPARGSRECRGWVGHPGTLSRCPSSCQAKEFMRGIRPLGVSLADTEVAHFDHHFACQENVGRLQIPSTQNQTQFTF